MQCYANPVMAQMCASMDLYTSQALSTIEQAAPAGAAALLATVAVAAAVNHYVRREEREVSRAADRLFREVCPNAREIRR